MNEDEIRTAVLGTLQRIAPEADLDSLDPDVEWQDQLDMDSMNVLDFMVGIEQVTGVAIPERDYAKVSTLHRCVDYLQARLAATVR